LRREPEDALLSLRELRISVGKGRHEWFPVRDVSFDVWPGETVGIVGESGSGKSLTCRSILRILPDGMSITDGELLFDGADVVQMDPRELRRLRRTSVGMVFQDPFSSLNPTYTVGSQLLEVLRVSAGLDRKVAKQRAIELLEHVEIEDANRRFASYPDELSGGMRQRVMIAMAIATGPRLLIADEATTALDVTTQAQILRLLGRLRDESDMAILLVSHDFGVVAENCDRIIVMYGGYVVESGSTAEIYTAPRHPYTAGLLGSIPMLESAGNPRRREAIPGQPPEQGSATIGCPFAPRCTYRRDECHDLDMHLLTVGEGHLSACPHVPAGTLRGAATVGPVS
jgi:oligopeptide/dipeptide ABC transporter ATP-binding protein